MDTERELQQTDEEAREEDQSAAEGRDEVSESEERPEPTAEGMDEPVQPLFPDEDLERQRARWKEIQVGFVDEPKQAVEQADALVNDLLERVNAGFADARSRLENQWDRGEDVSTEDLRMALTRYRAFFDRLLAA
jgi:hypothetical protein